MLVPYPRLLLSLLLFLLITPGCKEDTPDISGRYVGSQTFQSSVSPITILINCQSDQLTGSVTPPGSDQSIAFSNGTCSGTTIVFDIQEGSAVFRYSATYSPGDVAPSGLSGSIVAANATGTFTARFVSRN